MRNIINSIKENFKAYVIVFLMGIMLTWIIMPGSKNNKASGLKDIHNNSDKLAASIWTCSMHPQIRMQEKGDCPICGMDLIIQKNNDKKSSPYVINMNADAIELANIQTSEIVGSISANKQITLQGEVKIDESRNYTQSAHYTGRVEQLYISAEGDKVYKGQKIASIYSPEMLTAQQEFVQAISMKTEYPNIYNAARRKLVNLKISETDIENIESSGNSLSYFTILSEYSGYITKKQINKGDYIKKGQTLYNLSDMSRLWVEFDVYEKDLSFIQLGDIIEYRILSMGNKTFKAKVVNIDPVIDTKTRVAKIRVLLKNKNNRIKAEMFAEGIIHTKLKNTKDLISISKTAVMWTGKRSVAYVKVEGGFEMREIILGESLGDKYIIESGIKIGDKVVTNGSFTVDAAAQLSNKYSMMNRPKHKKETMFMGDKLSVNTKKEYYAFLDIYISIKNILVEGESNNVKINANAALKELLKTNKALKNSKIKDLWSKHYDDLYLNVKKLSETNDIEKQRIFFIKISEINITLIKSIGRYKQDLYIQFCSMADNNNGGSWISEQEEIRNPYFGHKMLKCGETKSIIK